MIIGDISSPLFIAAMALALWTLPWKGFALWRAAHRNDTWWFIVFLVVNTAGILEIVYLVVTRAKKNNASPSLQGPTSRV